uniref:AdmS n=1 Tax=Enterobacter agglomerans TaxID=549 RepID=Q84FK4_ENTAG|nr:AdmS [Pantoea agglomerans]
MILNSEDIKALYTERKPTKHDDYYHDISGSVSEIFKVARNIVEHYKGINKYNINPERYNDIDITQPEIILDRLSDAGVTSIINPIPFEHKLVGHCLTLAIVALDMMRYKNIPSRLRYAYCTYFSQDIYPEQILIEYWCEDKGAWLLGDPSMNQEVLDHNQISVNVDFCNVDNTLSQPIYQVWYHLRKGKLDFTMYRGINDRQERKQVLEEVARIFVNDLAMMNNLLLSIYDYVLTPYQSDHLSAELLQYLDEIADEMMASPGCLIAYDESNLIRYRPRTAVRKSVFRREEEIFDV